MLISSVEILYQMHQLECDFNLENKLNSHYTIASLFNKTDKGFYFFTGKKGFPDNINNSVVLVNEDYEENIKHSNIFIKIPVEKDVQQIYYQILSNLHSRKSNGIISKNSEIHAETKIGKNVQIDAFSVIEQNVRIGDNVIISSHVKIHAGSKFENNVIIESGSVIGCQGVAWTWNVNQTERIIQPQLGGVHIFSKTFLGAQTVIVRGSLNEDTTIGGNCVIAPGCRLGHGTVVEDYCHFANNITTGGNTYIGKYSFIGSGAILRPGVKLHPKTIVGAGALVVKNTSEENKTLIGVPAKEIISSDAPSGMPKPKK